MRGLNGGEPTAIEKTEAANNFDAPKAIYNLSGVRLQATSLEALPAGIYIVNGKKVVK